MQTTPPSENNPYAPPPIPQQQGHPAFANSPPGNQAFANQPFGGGGGGGMMMPDRSGLILGLGIGSLVTALLSCAGVAFAPCGFSGIISLGLGIAAWVMGNTDIRAMQQGRMNPAGLSTTRTGKTCGMIGVILFIVGFLLVLLLLALGVFAAIAAAAAGAGP
jgi:hypothetical protein